MRGDTHLWVPTPMLSSILKELFSYSDVSPKPVSGWLQSLPTVALNGIGAQWGANNPGVIVTSLPLAGSFNGFQTV
jgi:hypothetical protein